MPTVAFKSKVRTTSDYCTLTVIIRHRVVVGEGSNIVHDMKLSLPEGVEILIGPQLLITISGMLNGARIIAENLVDSRIANHLVEYLRLNAVELGINAVSNPHISEDTNLLTFSCTGSRPLPTSTESLSLHSHLVGFDLDYLWQTNTVNHPNEKNRTQMTAAMNPFSRHLSLPFLTVLNNAVERLVTFQLVRRYPLVFGSWCKQLDIERQFFSSIHSSIAHIMERSTDEDFYDTCKELLKLCRKRIASSSKNSGAALSHYLGTIECVDSSMPSLRKTEEEAFVLLMSDFYCLGLKRPLFKGLSVFCIPDDKEDDNWVDDLPTVGDNRGFASDSSLDVKSPSHAFQALPENDDDCHSDVLDCLEYFSDPGSLLAFDLNSPCDNVAKDYFGQYPLRLSSNSHHVPKSENTSNAFDDEDSDDMFDFAGHAFPDTSLEAHGWTNGVYDDASTDSDLDHPAIHNDFLFTSRYDWSPDIDTSQEDFDGSFGANAIPMDDMESQPHKVPSLSYSSSPTIPPASIELFNYDSDVGVSSPLILTRDYDSDHDIDGDFFFPTDFDRDLFSEKAQREGALTLSDYESGSDDHEVLVF